MSLSYMECIRSNDNENESVFLNFIKISIYLVSSVLVDLSLVILILQSIGSLSVSKFNHVFRLIINSKNIVKVYFEYSVSV